MVEYLDICKICLRTNVNLKEIDNVLANYFAVLTEFRLSKIDSRLCTDCTYLLGKNYNFSKNCEKSTEILQKWIEQDMFEYAGKTKVPLNSLHKEIPQICLQLSTQEGQSKEYIFCFQEQTGTSLDLYNVSNIGQSTQNIIKQEICSNDTEILNNSHDVKIGDATNSFHQVLIQNDLNTKDDDTEMINENGDDFNLNDDHLNESDDEIKYDIDMKSHEENDDFNLNDDHLNESDDEIKYDIDMKSHEENDISETKDDFSSDDECLAEIIRKKSLIQISNKNDMSDNMSINNVLNEKFAPRPEEMDEHVEKNENNVFNKLQLMNKDLTAVYNDWENICLTELTSIPMSKHEMSKIRVSKSKMSEIHKSVKGGRKGLGSKIEKISFDLDAIKDKCQKLLDYKHGLLNPEESLRSVLKSKFSTCGELKTADGFVIDKDTIIRCFDRLSDRLMKRLWRFMQGESFDPRAINTLKHIQTTYQNEFQYDSVFNIVYLNTKEKLAEEFEKRKTYQCYLDSKYKCEICYLGFRREAQMEYHRQTHEETAGDFVCPVCSIRLKQKRTLENHMRCHEAVYRCKLCPLVTYFRSSAKNHYNQHKGLEYTCEKCNIRFKSKSAQKTHIWLRHTEGAHTCSTCDRSFATQGTLVWHTARCHKRSIQPTVSCPDCEMKFTSKHAYSRHAKSHSTAAVYNTSQTNKDGTQRKKPVHTCRVCNVIGHSVGWLSLHFRESHPTVDMAALYADKQPHLCELCGKSYSNMYSLREHLAIHSGIRAHSCVTCGARFHRAISLAQHAATHAPPRRACKLCGKRFRSLSNLNNHTRGHIGDRRYKCNLCGKGFLHRNALNEHVRGVHYKQRRTRRKTTDNRANMTFDTDTNNMTVDTSS